MLRRHVKDARNRLDLNDRVQVRIVRKRLKVSDRQLTSLVETVGNSITAITKEANARKGVLETSEIPDAAVIASVQKAEAVAEEASPVAAAPKPAA